MPNRGEQFETLTFFFILITALPAVASAEFNDIFDILNETEFSGDWNISVDHPNAIETVQSSQHIHAWIDIIGFEDTTKIGNISYIDGSSVPEPIVEYAVWDAGLGWNDNLDYVVIDDERIITVGNITTAEIDIHLKWHHSELKSRKICTPLGCRTIKWIKKTYHHEYATFTASIPTPQPYPAITELECYITIYNNSFNPHIKVYIPLNDTILRTEYRYGNDAIVRYSMIGLAETGSVNLTTTHQWSEPTDNLTFIYDTMVIKNTNTSQFNLSDLTITVVNPYESKQLTNSSYNVTEITHIPGKEFHPFFYYFVAVVLIFIILIYANLKRMRF
ncbi:hypothetical protein KAR91_59340 [Candidatus Pacearchaeota archaeon]|nr:hypothetical protein [Candidatus Pacearchaeota archaeon]